MEVNITQIDLRHSQVRLLELIASGYSNKQIAFKINRSEDTVKNSICRIMQRLNANNRAHAVVIGLQQGIIKLSEVNQ